MEIKHNMDNSITVDGEHYNLLQNSSMSEEDALVLILFKRGDISLSEVQAWFEKDNTHTHAFRKRVKLEILLREG